MRQEPKGADMASEEELRKALKAFKKRLKVTRLDDESKIGHGPMSSGQKDQVVSIQPPSGFGAAIWEELVDKGYLRRDGRGSSTNCFRASRQGAPHDNPSHRSASSSKSVCCGAHGVGPGEHPRRGRGGMAGREGRRAVHESAEVSAVIGKSANSGPAARVNRLMATPSTLVFLPRVTTEQRPKSSRQRD